MRSRRRGIQEFSSALVYPLLVLLIAVGVTAYMVVYLIPATGNLPPKPWEKYAGNDSTIGRYLEFHETVLSACRNHSYWHRSFFYHGLSLQGG